MSDGSDDPSIDMDKYQVNVSALDHIGLFTQVRGTQTRSQRELAETLVARFNECMRNTVAGHFCAMPGLCAAVVEQDTIDVNSLKCAHLSLPFEFSPAGSIPLPGADRALPRHMDRQQQLLRLLVDVGALVDVEEFGPRSAAYVWSLTADTDTVWTPPAPPVAPPVVQQTKRKGWLSW